MDNRILFENGTIITMDRKTPLAHNLLVQDDTIMGVNVNNAGLPDVTTYDLAGRTVMPGLNDSHIHLAVTGLKNLDMVDLQGIKSLDDLKQRVKKYIETHNIDKGEWVLGWGWRDSDFAPEEELQKQVLDDISRQHPIFLTRICGHLGVLNSRALKESGITADTEVEGGVIETDDRGRLTGVVSEKARKLVYDSVPEFSVDKIKEIIITGAEMFRRVGLTTVQTDDFAAFFGSKDKVMQAYRELAENNNLPIKVVLKARLESPDEIDDFYSRYSRRSFSDHFTLGPVKLFADGSLGAKTAALEEAYVSEEDNFGVMVEEKKQLEAKIETAFCNDIQVACHAIGDRAMEIILDILEKMQSKYGKNGRQRIIHAQVTDLDLIKRMSALEVVADVQPGFVGSEWDYARRVLGQSRSLNTYAWKTMMETGLTTAGGSDSPVESYDPWRGIRCAVTRQDNNDQPPGGWQPQEKVTLHEALKMYTVNSAYSCQKEDEIGRLAPGYKADFIIVDENPHAIPPQELENIDVTTSVINGDIKEY